MSQNLNILDPGLIMKYLELNIQTNEILMSGDQLKEFEKKIHFDFNEWAKDWDVNLRAQSHGKFSMVLQKRFADKIKSELDYNAPASLLLDIFPEYFVGVRAVDLDTAHTPARESTAGTIRMSQCFVRDIMNMSATVDGITLTSNWYLPWMTVMHAHHVGYKL